MSYLSVKQTSEKGGISVRRVNILCSEGWNPEITKTDIYWAIPADAEKPKDARIKLNTWEEGVLNEERRLKDLCLLVEESSEKALVPLHSL